MDPISPIRYRAIGPAAGGVWWAGGEVVRVAVMGELSDIGVADMLELLTRRERTGRLTIKADGLEVDLYLDCGRLVLATSTDLTLRLGRMLVRRGLLAPQQLLEALHQQVEAGRERALGTMLLARGLVSADDIAACVEEQGIEILARVVTAQHGVFIYLDRATPPPHLESTPLDPNRVLLEATRRTAELAELRRALPDPTAPLTLASATVSPTRPAVGPETEVVKALRRGVASLTELADGLALDELTLGRAVLGLLERDLVVAHPVRAAS